VGRQRKEETVAKLINCECGYVVRGDSDDELIRNTEAHIDEHHPIVSA